MTDVRIIVADIRAGLAQLEDDSVDCVVTSPPYWGLRDYGVEGQLGLEPTLGEHLEVMVDIFREIRRVLKPTGTLWLNYGDCYATKPNGRSAAATKAKGTDDRTFRDKPFSTVGAIQPETAAELLELARRMVGDQDSDKARALLERIDRCLAREQAAAGPVYDPSTPNAVQTKFKKGSPPQGRVRAGGRLKPKDLCLIPSRLAIALQDDGWWVRSEIVWGKLNPMPDSSGRWRPSTAHEKIYLLTKSGRSYYDHAAVAQKSSENSHARAAVVPVAGWADGVGVPHDARSHNRGAKGRKSASDPRAVPPGASPQTGLEAADKRRKRRAAPAGVTPKALATVGQSVRPRSNPNFNAALGTAELVESRYLRNYEAAPDTPSPAVLEAWAFASKPFKGAHFATFPPELAERCILAGCPKGGVVLDPFGGAGTTGLVAARLGRKAVLIELNPDYARMARRRLKAALARVVGADDETATDLPLLEAIRKARPAA